MSIKKNLFALFLFVCIIQISCSKDASNEDFSIVGKWNLNSNRIKTTPPNGSGIKPSDSTIVRSNSTIEFKSDGTYQSNDGTVSTNGYYQRAGNTIKSSASANFSNPQSSTIETLTSNTMVLYSTTSQNVNGVVVPYETWLNLSR